MIKKALLTGIALTFAASSALAIPTLSLNCAGKRIKVGDSLRKVQRLCGQASKVKTGGRKVKLYYMDPRKSTKFKLKFRNNILSKIETTVRRPGE